MSLAEWVARWAAARDVGPGDDAPILQQRRWLQGLAQWVARLVLWWEGQPCGALAPGTLTRNLRCRDPARRGVGGLAQLGWKLALLTPQGQAPPRRGAIGEGLCSTPWCRARGLRAPWLIPLGEVLAHTVACQDAPADGAPVSDAALWRGVLTRWRLGPLRVAGGTGLTHPQRGRRRCTACHLPPLECPCVLRRPSPPWHWLRPCPSPGDQAGGVTCRACHASQPRAVLRGVWQSACPGQPMGPGGARGGPGAGWQVHESPGDCAVPAPEPRVLAVRPRWRAGAMPPRIPLGVLGGSGNGAPLDAGPP